MVLRSPVNDLMIPDVSFSQFMLSSLKKRDRNRTALVIAETGEKYNYGEVTDFSMKYAAAFSKLGLKKGEVVAVFLPNCLDYPLLLIAASACGAAFTTCNPTYTETEVLGQFKLSKPSFVIVEEDGLEMVTSLAKKVPSIRRIFTTTEVKGCLSLPELRKTADLRDFPYDITIDNEEDVCLLPYSSGTTGLPKGVMLSHKNFVSNVAICRFVIANTPIDVGYCVLPFFHIYGAMVMSLFLDQGSLLVIQRRFSLDGFYNAVHTYKVTFAPLVPPIILAMHNFPIPPQYDLSSLKRVGSGAAPLPGGVGEGVSKKVGCNVSQGWGLSEAVPLTMSPPVSVPITSVGIVCPNTKMKVIDIETGHELGPNKRGELCAKGPQIMKGYYNNPQATAGCLEPSGWFHTGDIGYYDDNGFIYVVDRMKELIKYKGFQVAPAELEEFLLHHPKVSDAAVIGVPDPGAGEVPKAFLVRNDPGLTPAEIHDFIKGKLSSYKYLRGGIEFLDVIPKSASGKILRRELRDREMKKSKL